MQVKKNFINHYVIPGILMILVTLATALLILLYGNSDSVTVRNVTMGGILVILVLFVWIIVQILKNEAAGQKISKRLEETDAKYNALLETSTNGTLLLLGEDIISANFVFLAMSGYTLSDMKTMKHSELLVEAGTDLKNLIGQESEIGRTITTEAMIRCKRGDLREVILAVSGIRFNGTNGMIIIVKDISGRERIEKESMDLVNELQSSLLQMNLPVTTIVRDHISCDIDLSVLDAASIMSKKNQDAIIVMRNRSQPAGIVTDTDLRKRVVASELNYNNPVYEIMSSPIIRIEEQSLLYEAILKIKEHGISHLAVEDTTGKIIGIFSNNDLLDVQRNSISYLIKEIDVAESVESLKKIHNKIPVLTRILLESGSKIRNITYMISTVTDAITRRLADFAIEEMGEPPARFAFMALGSEGRREQTLVTDQDNAIVFEDVPNDRLAEVSRYFLYFGRKINLWLDRIGYRYCQGEVMAGNPQWCQPISKWKKYFNDWVNTRTGEGLLGIAVFFDFRIVIGMEQYGEVLRKHINKITEGKSAFYRNLAREISGYDIPLELAVPFDVKYTLAPMTDYIRVYSIQNKIPETNSMFRLERLQKHNIIDESDFKEIDNVYNRLMEIRFRSHVNAILENKAPDNIIRQEQLTDMEKTLVFKSFSEISRYQAQILDDFT